MKIDSKKVFALLRVKARGQSPDSVKAREFLSWLKKVARRADRPRLGWAKELEGSQLKESVPDLPPAARRTNLTTKATATIQHRRVEDLAASEPIRIEIVVKKIEAGQVLATIRSNVPTAQQVEVASVVCPELSQNLEAVLNTKEVPE